MTSRMLFCQSQEDEGRPPMSQRTVSRDSLHELFDDGMDSPVRLGKPPASPASVAKLERKVGKLLARVRHFEARERAFLERHDELKSTLDALDAGRGAAAEAQARAAAKYDAWREEKAAHAASARVAAEKNAELVQHRKGLYKIAAWRTGQEKRAKFPTSKAHISAVFHSFRLILGRATSLGTLSKRGCFFFGTRARRTPMLKRR